jgi:hypothetical protein
MSPDDRAAWVRAAVASAPPLSAAQAATIRGTLLSGSGNEEPPEPGAQGAAHPRIGMDQKLPDATDTRIRARRGTALEVA